MDILERCEDYQKEKILNIIEMSQQTYPDATLFFGDSLMNRFDAKKYFPAQEVINCGIDGATSQTLYLVLQNVLAMQPKQIIFLIGTNDLDDEHDFDLLDITFALYNQILLMNQKLPECKIGIISPLPIDERMKTRSRSNNALMRLGAEFKNLENELEHVTYIDLFEKFVEDGQLKREYTSDGLHLNELGYEVFAKELKQYLI